MLLKIKDFNSEYWMYSELKQVHYQRMKEKDLAKNRVEWEPFIEGVKTNSVLSLNPPELLETYTLFHLKYDCKKGFDFSIFLGSCVCYICNDEGKTIDKIVC